MTAHLRSPAIICEWQRERVNLLACQTYATSRDRMRAKASDQSARVSPEIVISPECFDLRWRPFVAENHRDLGDGELARSVESEVAVNDLTVASHLAWNLKTEIADRGAHSVYRGIVLARVPRVFYESFNGPQLDACHGAGVRPWRRITSASAAGLGGPPAAALTTAAISRK